MPDLHTDRRIAVVGAAGQLGSWLCELLGERAWALDLPEMDITDRAAVNRVFRAQWPAAIVNCAAYTAVDRAERESEVCRDVNALAVLHLAAVAAELDCPLVQISTDYVFGAPQIEPRPWRETDQPDPRGVYAESKFAGEQAAKGAPRHLVVRTCGLYGHASPDAPARSFVEAILARAARGEPLRVVADQRCSPSFAKHVAAAIIYLLDAGQQGLFHVTNTGEISWHDFAQAIVELTGSTSTLRAISTAEYGAAAPRPADSVLDGSKYAATGGPAMPGVREALAEYLALRGILASPPA
jgi:dTDP-4-dehydrorhamnose reductase